jgi:hypothetical protein|tara:strand:+ start:3517 stop:4167 length:651 start_codon:yes stop_codon:yes gene_type:complete
MGYLDNTSVVVDAILTKKGRELLSRQDGSFNVTQFALADDEIDYTLYNESHPNGSAFYGEAIEALPLIEAIPNENSIMVSKLITLNRGTSQIPVLDVASSIIKGRNATFSINPQTLNFSGNTEIYSFTISDRRLISTGATNGGAGVEIPFTGTALSETYVGSTFTGMTLGGITLFGSNTALATSIIVVGLDSGARSTVTLTVTKVAGGDSSAPANS